MTQNNLEKKGSQLTHPSSVEAGAGDQTGEKGGTMEELQACPQVCIHISFLTAHTYQSKGVTVHSGQDHLHQLTIKIMPH